MSHMLFDARDIPRAPTIKRMHVIDAGDKCIRFKCGHCGHDTGWIVDEWTVTENRRGHPCPSCQIGGAA